jgi:hypothetical protein
MICEGRSDGTEHEKIRILEKEGRKKRQGEENGQPRS